MGLHFDNAILVSPNSRVLKCYKFSLWFDNFSSIQGFYFSQTLTNYPSNLIWIFSSYQSLLCERKVMKFLLFHFREVIQPSNENSYTLFWMQLSFLWRGKLYSFPVLQTSICNTKDLFFHQTPTGYSFSSGRELFAFPFWAMLRYRFFAFSTATGILLHAILRKAF